MPSIYDFSAEQMSGKSLPLKIFKGQVMLMVNTASQCGFTPRLTEMQELHLQYGDKGLVEPGFPCNQFGAQANRLRYHPRKTGCRRRNAIADFATLG